MIKKILAVAALSSVLIGCASAPKSQDSVSQAVIADMAERDGASRFQIKDKLGNTKDVVMLPVFDFRSEITKIGSKDAKACEQFAGYSRAQESWLSVCESALADVSLSVENRRATEFNRGLILFALDRRAQADSVFQTLSEQHPNFAAPLAERAKIARLNLDFRRSVDFAQQALARGLDKPYRAYLLMGKAYEGDFEFDAARAAYGRAYDLAPTNRHVRQNYERFNALRPLKSANHSAP